jgi:hypothetical protein
MTKVERSMEHLKVLKNALKPVTSCYVVCLEAFRMVLWWCGGDMAEMPADRSAIIIITFG